MYCNLICMNVCIYVCMYVCRLSSPASSRRALSAPLKRPGVIIDGMNQAIALMGEANSRREGERRERLWPLHTYSTCIHALQHTYSLFFFAWQSFQTFYKATYPTCFLIKTYCRIATTTYLYVCMYLCILICEFMYLSFAMAYLLRHLLCTCRFGSHQQTPGDFGLELGEPC